MCPPLKGHSLQEGATLLFCPLLKGHCVQEPLIVGGPHLDGRVLAAAHAAEAGDAGPQRGQVGGAGGTPRQEMCLLEEVPPTAG